METYIRYLISHFGTCIPCCSYVSALSYKDATGIAGTIFIATAPGDLTALSNRCGRH